MVAEPLNRVLPLPTQTTVVLEAVHVATEERTHHPTAGVARSVLKIRINLDAFRELPCLDLHVARLNCFHVILSRDEGDASGSDWVLVSVCVMPA